MAHQTRAATRPVALLLGLCLLALAGGWLLLALQRAREDIAPPGASGVRVTYQGASHVMVSYYAPEGWSLLQVYAYLESQGWSRDTATERGMRQGQGALYPPGSTFAIFVRSAWFGQARELAIVGIDLGGHRLPLVRQVRCLPRQLRPGC